QRKASRRGFFLEGVWACPPPVDDGPRRLPGPVPRLERAARRGVLRQEGGDVPRARGWRAGADAWPRRPAGVVRRAGPEDGGRDERPTAERRVHPPLHQPQHVVRAPDHRGRVRAGQARAGPVPGGDVAGWAVACRVRRVRGLPLRRPRGRGRGGLHRRHPERPAGRAAAGGGLRHAGRVLRRRAPLARAAGGGRRLSRRAPGRQGFWAPSGSLALPGRRISH
ncbi:unnamed protein product, partial [Prorocentrum cordatum]